MLTIAGLLIAPLLATSATRPPKKAVEDSSSMTLVVVQNNRNVPVTLYVQNDETETRLATIAPLSNTTIRIPAYLTDQGEVSFFVHPQHELDEGTAPMEVRQGAHVGLIVPAKPKA